MKKKSKEAETKEATSGKGSVASAHARQVDNLKRKMVAIEKKLVANSKLTRNW